MKPYRILFLAICLFSIQASATKSAVAPLPSASGIFTCQDKASGARHTLELDNSGIAMVIKGIKTMTAQLEMLCQNYKQSRTEAGSYSEVTVSCNPQEMTLQTRTDDSLTGMVVRTKYEIHQSSENSVKVKIREYSRLGDETLDRDLNLSCEKNLVD